MESYFKKFDHISPPATTYLSKSRQQLWQLLAGLTIGLAIWYLHWRWTVSLNPDAAVFSVIVASAESLLLVGTFLFFHDIWEEKDTPKSTPPSSRKDAELEGDGPIEIDLFITTFNESTHIVEPSIVDAKALKIPVGVSINIYVLDDGNRPDIKKLSAMQEVNYLSREDNIGYKAGNLRNALLQTKGDFIVICDADTRVFPDFLTNTLGYFRDPSIAWVQTPHWFYDIPQGHSWEDVIERKHGIAPTLFARIMRGVTGGKYIGQDPFLSDPVLFYDIIQRRRNRHNASFCCGAGSIHRREAVFSSALHHKGEQARRLQKRLGGKPTLHMVPLEPYKFHVSEDIYTSIQMQSSGWKSVFHPDIESKMLSPMTMQAWSTQRLKYIGGTFDIMFRANPIFKRGMSLSTKLHYGATFWSYLALLWMPVILFAPVFSLFTGLPPLKAYSLEFFIHFLPVFLVNELAMHVGCKGYNTHAGRTLSLATIPLQAKGLWQVLRGQKLGFPTTPKTLFATQKNQYALPAVFVLLLFAAALISGWVSYQRGIDGFSRSLLIVNGFWIIWSSLSFLKVIQMSRWRPKL